MPRDDCHLRVEADSLNFTTGAVLSQEVDDKWYPIAFMSKSLNEVERNYVIYDKELLAIVRAFKEWSQYLKGVQYPILILTDHQNLKYFQTTQKLNCRQVHWSLILSDFDYVLEHHRPGSSMGKPDALFCRSDHDTGKEDNANIVLLEPHLFINALK